MSRPPLAAAIPLDQDRITLATARLEAWLETMRCPGGYGGPVVHWWQQSLLYTGRALDWRYEGIIDGYLTLWRRTGNALWLQKACRAGDDLLAGQMENGHFAASCFELNPASAGTPHEAACDVGLLLLAEELQTIEGRQQINDDSQQSAIYGFPDWKPYADCAQHNLQAFYLGKLWDAEAKAFRDDPLRPSFVPNKAATACEALFLLAKLRDNAYWVEEYVLPNLQCIVTHQIRDHSSLDGAIAQNTLGRRRIEKFFPKYIARCVPALVAGYHWTGDERYADAGRRAVHFLTRTVREDGSLPTVFYTGGRMNCWPSWVAPLADVLRAADCARDLQLEIDLGATWERLLAGQDASGGFQTAQGFAAQSGGQPGALPDVRDVMHVVGWCDKVFRVLANSCQGDLPDGASNDVFEGACSFQGRPVQFIETSDAIEIRDQDRTCYLWRKGSAWPEIAEPDFWLH